MAKKIFFAIVSVVLSVNALAWGQGPSYAPQGPYGPAAGPWNGRSGAVPASYQAEMMQTGPVQQSAVEGVATGYPCCQNENIPEWEAFGDFLYIRPRNANIAFAVAFSGTSTPPAIPIQEAQPGVASIDFHPGWRVGIAKSLDDCNAVVATFENYEGESQNSYASPPFLIRSMVSQPSTYTAASDATLATSYYRMIYNLADVDLRWTFENQDDTRLSLLAGSRFASLDQRFNSSFTSSAVQMVHTDVNFDGAGLRVGFDGERRMPLGLMFYGRATANVVAGTFRCAYTQTSSASGSLVNTGYPADRVVPIIDCEMGTGLSLWNDKLRLTAGYSFSGWFNVVRTDQFIGAVRDNNFSGMNNTLTFDGFVGRVELEF